MIVAEHLSARFRLDDETEFEPHLTEDAIHSCIRLVSLPLGEVKPPHLDQGVS